MIAMFSMKHLSSCGLRPLHVALAMALGICLSPVQAKVTINTAASSWNGVVGNAPEGTNASIQFQVDTNPPPLGDRVTVRILCSNGSGAATVVASGGFNPVQPMKGYFVNLNGAQYYQNYGVVASETADNSSDTARLDFANNAPTLSKDNLGPPYAKCGSSIVQVAASGEAPIPMWALALMASMLLMLGQRMKRR